MDELRVADDGVEQIVEVVRDGLARDICVRRSRSCGVDTACSRFAKTSRADSRAWTSVRGELALDTSASVAWVRASRPVEAVSSGVKVVVISGSVSDTSGTTALLMMAIL